MRSAVAPAASTISISATEAASKQEPRPAKQRKHLRRRVRLDGVEHPGVRQGLGKVLVVGAHDVEVDDEARAFVHAAVAAILKEFTDARSHFASLSPQAQGGIAAMVMRVFEAAVVRDGDAPPADELSTRFSLPWFGLGRPRTARPARMDKPLRLPEPVVETGKTREARSVVALSRVPR